jgi:hypothetical protein
MAFDSLHLSPSDCAVKVMKSKRLDSKRQRQSTCMVCVTIEKEKNHRVAGLIFSYVAFAGLFICSYQFPFLTYSFSCFIFSTPHFTLL